METNGSVTTYLLLAAFAVGQRFRFDCCLLGSAPPTWWATPWRLVGESAAPSPSLLHLQRLTGLTLCVSWLALCKTMGSWSSLLAVFDTLLLGHFVCCTETFRTTHMACMEFSSCDVWITSWGQEMANNLREMQSLSISCNPLDWQLSALLQVLNSFLPSISTLESLEITIDHEDWPDEIKVIQWQEFLHPFTC